MSIIIITQKNKTIEYDNSIGWDEPITTDAWKKALCQCLDIYIKNELAYEQGFLLSEKEWLDVLYYQKSNTLIVELFNSLCKNDNNKINKILVSDSKVSTDFFCLYPVNYSKDGLFYVIVDGGKHVEVHIGNYNSLDHGSSIEIEATVDYLPVTSITEGCFSNLDDTSYIHLPSTIRYIGPYAFSDCWLLHSIDIPDGVTRIEHGTFSQCTNLKHISIPKSVKYIDKYAFDGCTNIETIYYSGTEEDYKNVEVCKEGNEEFNYNLIVFNSNLDDI